MWLDNLKNLKKLSGYTTKEIADRSGIPEPTLEKIFSGATKEPKLPTIQRLVHFLGYTLDDLEDSSTASHSASMSALTRDETQLVLDYRKLSPVGAEYIRQTMAMAVHSYAGEDSAVPQMEAAE